MYQMVQCASGGRKMPDPDTAENTTPDARERLLEAVVAYMAEHGAADLSLRRLGAAIGTSHRMLLYHFGSKPQLLVEVVRTVEERQRAALADLVEDAGPLSPADVGRRMWARLADPALGPSERLFFELYGQALQGTPGTVELLDGIVESWVEPIAALRRAEGMPEDRARARARLELATTRGLLLDLLATGDRAGVDAAVGEFIELVGAAQSLAPPR
jgi:AcrR family transcriptional regulator